MKNCDSFFGPQCTCFTQYTQLVIPSLRPTLQSLKSSGTECTTMVKHCEKLSSPLSEWNWPHAACKQFRLRPSLCLNSCRWLGRCQHVTKSCKPCQQTIIYTWTHKQNSTSIHRHQTLSRYHHSTHGHRCTMQPPCFGVTPITAKRDVIHKTGSTQHSAMPPEEDRATAMGSAHKILW